ncbi:MAG: phage holin family protein [Moraxellaceae bacterium]|nr:phage holin family protein [Moraxellaceae bacterium]
MALLFVVTHMGNVRGMMMYHMIVRLLLSACGLGLADYLLDGVRFDHFSTMFWAALLLGGCQ